MIKIIVIDDDELIRDGLKSFLEMKSYEVQTAESGEQGIELIKNTIPHIVFLDIGLPGISGIEVLKQIMEYDKTIRVIMISAISDEDTIDEAKKIGASDYITKPFSMEYLNNVVISKISAQTIEHQRDTIIQIVYALANALEAKDNYTGGHSEEVSKYTEWIAEEINTKPGWEWVQNKMGFLKNLAMLHDIGKMGVKDNILNKADKLDCDEFESMRKHPVVGANIVSVIEDLASYSKGVLYHHERWDGKGYPEGIKGEDIPGEARILAVADSYDAMTTDRPYRNALNKEESIKQLNEGKGTQFDPVVVEAFIEALKKHDC